MCLPSRLGCGHHTSLSPLWAAVRITSQSWGVWGARRCHVHRVQPVHVGVSKSWAWPPGAHTCLANGAPGRPVLCSMWVWCPCPKAVRKSFPPGGWAARLLALPVEEPRAASGLLGEIRPPREGTAPFCPPPRQGLCSPVGTSVPPPPRPWLWGCPHPPRPGAEKGFGRGGPAGTAPDWATGKSEAPGLGPGLCGPGGPCGLPASLLPEASGCLALDSPLGCLGLPWSSLMS